MPERPLIEAGQVGIVVRNVDVQVIGNHENSHVFIGLDVGKGELHAVALDRAGKKLFDKALPNDEVRLREILASLNKHGSTLLVVDQSATIGALPVAVAQAAGVTLGYLPGLAMRRIADLHPGEAKNDARDAFIIADAARTMPHTLRPIQIADEQLAELTCSAASTTIWPNRPPQRRTGSAAC